MTTFLQITPSGPLASVSRRMLPVLFCALPFVLGLCLRLMYNDDVLKQFSKLAAEEQSSNQIGYLMPDSPGYLEPAAKLREGRFAEAISPTRPIGYPLLLALTGVNAGATLTTQAVLLSLIPVCTFLLVSLLTRNHLLGFVSGLISCISPTGIAIGALVLSDALFSALFAMLFVALAYGASRNSSPLIVFSALLSGMGLLVKPILLLWPPLSVAIYCLFAQSDGRLADGSRSWLKSLPHRWGHGLVLFLLPLLFSISWAGLNYVHNGIFTVSTVGATTTRYYLAARIEEWEIAGRRPEDAAVRERQRALLEHFAGVPIQEQLRAYASQSRAIFKEHPLRTAQVLVDDALGNYLAVWDHFRYQLPLRDSKLSLVLMGISVWESRGRKVALVPLLLGSVLVFIVAKVRASGLGLELARALAALTLTFLYFALCSGLTFWTGPRILYPTEMLIIVTMAVFSVLIVRICTASGSETSGERGPV